MDSQHFKQALETIMLMNTKMISALQSGRDVQFEIQREMLESQYPESDFKQYTPGKRLTYTVSFEDEVPS